MSDRDEILFLRAENEKLRQEIQKLKLSREELHSLIIRYFSFDIEASSAKALAEEIRRHYGKNL